jgi:hypothetical protein
MIIDIDPLRPGETAVQGKHRLAAGSGAHDRHAAGARQAGHNQGPELVAVMREKQWGIAPSIDTLRVGGMGGTLHVCPCA